MQSPPVAAHTTSFHPFSQNTSLTLHACALMHLMSGLSNTRFFAQKSGAYATSDMARGLTVGNAPSLHVCSIETTKVVSNDSGDARVTTVIADHAGLATQGLAEKRVESDIARDITLN